MHELEDKLKAANVDPAVHGIMIYPCFGAKPSFYGGNMDDYLRDLVSVEKDVEGLCYTCRRYLYHNIATCLSSTALQRKKVHIAMHPLLLSKFLSI